MQWLAPAWGNRLLDRGTPYARLVCTYWPRAALYTRARESCHRDLINGSVTSVSWFWKYGWRLLHCLSEKFKFGKISCQIRHIFFFFVNLYSSHLIRFLISWFVLEFHCLWIYKFVWLFFKWTHLNILCIFFRTFFAKMMHLSRLPYIQINTQNSKTSFICHCTKSNWFRISSLLRWFFDDCFGIAEGSSEWESFATERLVTCWLYVWDWPIKVVTIRAHFSTMPRICSYPENYEIGTSCEKLK